MKTINHTILIAALITLIPAYIAVFAVGYALLWPIRTLEIQNYSEAHPVKLEATTVHPGEQIKYKLDYCKYYDGDVVVNRTMVDGQIIILTPGTGRLPIGCHNNYVTDAMIPETVNPGKYYLDVVVDYKINVFRTEHIHYHTEYFNVVASN